MIIVHYEKLPQCPPPSRVAGDVLNGQNIDYLEKEDHTSSNVMFKSKKSFAVELYDYGRKQVDLFKLSDGRDQRRNRSNPFSVEDALQISESYTVFMDWYQRQASVHRLEGVCSCLH